MHLNIDQLFRPLEIGPITARNRLMRSATHESAADESGMPDIQPLVRIHSELVRGGIGLLVVGHSFVHPNGRASMNQTGLSSDDHAQAWESILRDVRATCDGNCPPIFAQLACVGRQSHVPGAPMAANDKRDLLPPNGTPFGQWHERQIQAIIKAFADAARRARAAGFDGVQVHMAHGYLLSEALSLHTNKRDDRWGGEDPENRRRLPLAVIDAVREAAGDDLALSVKLNGSDYLPPDGVEPAEAAETARQLTERGVHLVEVSAGMAEAGMKTAQPVHGPEDEAFLLPFAREVARVVETPLATVGGYRTAPVMLRALGEGLDMVSLSRALIREPDLPNKLQSDPGHVAACISCNRCFTIRSGTVRCPLDHPEPID